MNRQQRRARENSAAAGGLLKIEIVGPAGQAALVGRAEAGDEAAQHLVHWANRAAGKVEGANLVGCGLCGRAVASEFVACIATSAREPGMAGCLLCSACAGRPASWPTKARAALTRIMGAARADELPGHAGGRA